MRKILIKKSRNGQFYFTVVSVNGQTLVTSETYTRKGNCKKTAEKFSRYLYIKVIDTTKK